MPPHKWLIVCQEDEVNKKCITPHLESVWFCLPVVCLTMFVRWCFLKVFEPKKVIHFQSIRIIYKFSWRFFYKFTTDEVFFFVFLSRICLWFQFMYNREYASLPNKWCALTLNPFPIDGSVGSSNYYFRLGCWVVVLILIHCSWWISFRFFFCIESKSR